MQCGRSRLCNSGAQRAILAFAMDMRASKHKEHDNSMVYKQRLHSSTSLCRTRPPTALCCLGRFKQAGLRRFLCVAGQFPLLCSVVSHVICLSKCLTLRPSLAAAFSRAASCNNYNQVVHRLGCTIQARLYKPGCTQTAYQTHSICAWGPAYAMSVNSLIASNVTNNFTDTAVAWAGKLCKSATATEHLLRYMCTAQLNLTLPYCWNLQIKHMLSPYKWPHHILGYCCCCNSLSTLALSGRLGMAPGLPTHKELAAAAARAHTFQLFLCHWEQALQQ